MKRGFELFKTKNQNEKINLLEYDNKFGFQLPPLFKIFIETFETGEESLKREYYEYLYIKKSKSLWKSKAERDSIALSKKMLQLNH